MRVAWLTHHVMDDREGSGLLPGQIGGAEMTDAAMIAAAPATVSVDIVTPDRWEEALSADRIVVTGTDLLPPAALRDVGARKPLVWVHHRQTRSEPLQAFLEAADVFLCMSKLHASVEAEWIKRPILWNNGFIDPDCVQPGLKDGSALWASRNHPQKGRVWARKWAAENNMPLREITDAPHADVLAAMSTAAWFVFLPQSLDACPRVLIEAELAGCAIHTNGNAGRRDPGDIREVLTRQPEKFWSMV